MCYRCPQHLKFIHFTLSYASARGSERLWGQEWLADANANKMRYACAFQYPNMAAILVPIVRVTLDQQSGNENSGNEIKDGGGGRHFGLNLNRRGMERVFSILRLRLSLRFHRSHSWNANASARKWKIFPFLVLAPVCICVVVVHTCFLALALAFALLVWT